MLTPDEVIDGKYRIVKMIGKGGMGAVYEGENLRIARKVAIKVLHASVAEDQGHVQRFEREAQAAGRIGSDHIVEVLDLGDLPNGDRYMVMEFLDGESLRARMQRLGKMQPVEIVPIVCDLCDGLADAHNAGIIHRDLKPDNVFLVEEKKRQADFVKLVDFGVSKFRALSDQVTQTGVVFGTPHYMSPEQAKGEKNIDQRADLYSVGVILYKALSGTYPFEADTFNELMFKVVLEDPRALYEHVPEINDELSMIVHKAMARDPDARFQTAEEMAGCLREWLNSHGFATSFQRTVAPRIARAIRPSGEGEGKSAADAKKAEAPPSAGPTRVEGRGDQTKDAGEAKGEKSDLAAETSTRMTASAAVPAVTIPEKKPRWPLFAAAALLLVVLGGGGFFALRKEPTAAGSDARSSRPAFERSLEAADEKPKASAAAPQSAQTSPVAGRDEASAPSADKGASPPPSAAPSARHSSGVKPPGSAAPPPPPVTPSVAPPPPPPPIAAPSASHRVFRPDI